jgi:hypothetical protein
MPLQGTDLNEPGEGDLGGGSGDMLAKIQDYMKAFISSGGDPDELQHIVSAIVKTPDTGDESDAGAQGVPQDGGAPPDLPPGGPPMPGAGAPGMPPPPPGMPPGAGGNANLAAFLAGPMKGKR